MVANRRFCRQFYRQDARFVARNLLGRILLLQIHDELGAERSLTARIVETEAYLPDDPASHSFRGRTQRNASMFLDGGHVYVYRIYGIHNCLNIVTGSENEGAAVLIRAVEPLNGIELMWENRYEEKLTGQLSGYQALKGRLPVKLTGLSNGPGKLCRSFGISVDTHDGIDLAERPLRILDGASVDEAQIGTSARIGLTAGKGDKKLWRFFVRNSPFLSRY